MSSRPKQFSFTPANESTTHFATALTGAGPFIPPTGFTRSATTDALAHQVTLTSAANLSGSNITINGTDADDRTIAETIAGPNVNTVETTKFFKTITSITASVSLGANTMDVGIADEFVSPTLPQERYLVSGFPPAVQVIITGTINFDIEDTDSDFRDTPNSPPAQDTLNWLNDANFTNKTASLAANLAYTPQAIRFVANSYSAGATVKMTVHTP